ncbi:hypothetical protein GCE86_07465 [Micromonospora terminaliae]|uniref:Uncharacterized protein n=1 Tax=Micromonospora terminaliae TaxID=1914461 RepID=A0AAJ3DKJ4_9ACTN|nr:hypothetical protein [Micromonospora terminaliae]NES29912.1 hypothetical protein [Micromonospora terminaliae]QGL46907.1 hypothetical protein GCE86_07465 [Micromonospora terminaliae]
MTTRRSTPAGRHPELGRQIAWTRRENERRRCAYEAAARTWRRRAEHLERLRIEATGFHGCTLPGADLPVELDDGEVVYRVVPVAELVEAEARHVPGLPAPDPALTADLLDPADGALPNGLRVVDTGAAVVTDRRVAFAGRAGRREWAHDDLLGLGHHPDLPVTLLHLGDGRRPAGLRVPVTGAANVRFYLTLAYATATGTRDALATQLDALLAAHRAARPRPPRPLGVADAPAPRRRPARLAAAGAVAVGVLLGVTAAGTWPATAGPVHRTGAATDGAAQTPDDDRSPDPVLSTPDGGSTRSKAGEPTRLRRPADGVRRPAVTGTPTPSGTEPIAPPAPSRTTPPPTTAPAAPTTPAVSPTGTPAPTGTPTGSPTVPPTGSPSPSASTRSGICLHPLRLPVVDPLLCRRI